MNPSDVFRRTAEAIDTHGYIPDPGDTNTIKVFGTFMTCNVVTAGAETRTLRSPIKAGLYVAIVLKTDGGDLTLTVTDHNAAGTDTIVFNTAGQIAFFISVNNSGTLEWRPLMLPNSAAMTTALTALTHTAPTPDYAIQNLTTTTPFGFADIHEGNTVLSVIVANAVRIAEIETILQKHNLTA